MKIDPISTIKRMRDPDRMFDLIIYAAYIHGQLGRPIPVDDSRDVFEKIKQRLRN